jgi:hypothetical protein
VRQLGFLVSGPHVRERGLGLERWSGARARADLPEKEAQAGLEEIVDAKRGEDGMTPRIGRHRRDRSSRSEAFRMWVTLLVGNLLTGIFIEWWGIA